MERIKIVLAMNWRDAQGVEAALKDVPEMEIVSMSTTASGAYRDATEMEADLVLLSPLIPGFQASLISDLLHHDDFPVATIGLLPPLESRIDEMRAMGMKGHVSSPLDPAQSRRLLELIPEAVINTRLERQNRTYVPLDGPTLATIAEAGWQRMVLAFWGTGGGVGKTSLAINLAAALGVLGKRATLLMDLDMTRGAVASRLGLQPDRNVFALFNALLPEYQRQGRAVCTPATFNRNIQPWGGVNASKLDCLAGIPAMHVAGMPVFRENGERTRALVREIIIFARKQYDFVIIDLGPDVNNEVHFAALDTADLVLTVVRPDIADIHSTAEAVPRLKQAFGEGVGKFELVINQWTDQAGLRMREIIEFIGMKKFGTIPYDLEYTYAGNQQRPFVLEKPNPTSDAIVSMANRFFPSLGAIWVRRGGQIEGERGAFRQPARREGPGLGGLLKRVFVK